MGKVHWIILLQCPTQISTLFHSFMVRYVLSASFMHCAIAHLKVKAISDLELFEQRIIFAYKEMPKGSLRVKLYKNIDASMKLTYSSKMIY